ncbi:MAG: tetratricopeptide repeat protein, partial [Candidatus Omnitrophota bacterium]
KLGTYALIVAPIFVLTNTSVMYGYASGFSRPNYHRGRAYLKQIGREGDALSEFKIALHKHPGDPDIYEAMGYAYTRQGNLKKAEACYKKALDIEESFPKAMNSLGVIYAKQGRMDVAKETFEKIIKNFPLESTNAYINLGNCYRMEGDYRMAEKKYEKALLTDPENPNVLNKLWSLYEEMGDPRSKKIKNMYENALKKMKHSA